MPSKKEQFKIGFFFYNFDKLIALHKQQLDLLKEQKKELLQKMFPKEGSNVPELRFPEFVDPWEQRKLGDLFEQTNETIDPKENGIELWSLTVEDGLISKPERYNREAITKKEDKYKVVYPSQIVFNPMNMTIGAIGINKNSFPIAVSGYYVVLKKANFKESIDTNFYMEWMVSPQALKLYKNWATGSLLEKQRVQYSTFSKIGAYFPKYEEQVQIGSFFSNFDNLITLHQHKLNLLKEQKKELLQKMFPEDGEVEPKLRFPEFK